MTGFCSLRAGALGAGVSIATWQVTRRLAPLARTNFAGAPVSLALGPAWAVGALAALAIAPESRRVRRSISVGVGAATAIGLVDDLAGRTDIKGLAGHFGALAHGELTTGALKAISLPVVGLGVGAGLAHEQGCTRRAGEVFLNGIVIAGSANVINLFDLRPGRALKVATAVGVAAAAAGRSPGLAIALLGPSAAVAGPDLHEEGMLGDGGSNALGAAMGAIVCRAPVPMRVGAAAGLIGLTLASEKVSFSRLIERTPALNSIDQWGRRATTSTTASTPGRGAGQ